MELLDRIKTVFGAGRRRARLAAGEAAHYFTSGARRWDSSERERYDYDREDVLAQALEAWRANPLARRIVGLTTQYVVGGGLRVRVDHPYTHRFVESFWQHRLNQMPMRVYEWCDELTRAGELFLLVSTDPAGMSYARAVAGSEISEVITAENDLQQETGYVRKAAPGEEPTVWAAYNEAEDGRGADGSFPAVMLHYAINRPVGAVRGESDLAPLLRWLSRYSSWLEDRARLNKYRNAFMYVVKGRWASEEERYARQNALALNPPSPGSFLVTDESETWEALAPRLESQDANEDGLALKKMILAGSGLPLHFLAEPEGSNRSTAESAGGPTYRHFEQRQEFFTWLIGDLARVVIRRRALVDGRVRARADLQVTGADLSARDNAALAIALSTVVNGLGALRDRAIIDDAELLRMVYRFAGEVVDVEQLLARGRKEGHPPQAAQTPGAAQPNNGAPAGVKVNPRTDNVLGIKSADNP